MQAGACVARPWGAPIELSAGVVDPRADVASDGGICVAWVSTDDGAAVTAAHEDDGFVPAQPEADGSRPSHVRVAGGTDGQVDVVWRAATGMKTTIRHGRRVGGAWRWDERALSLGDVANEPEVIASASSEVLAVWNQWTGVNWGIAVGRSIGDTPLSRPADIYDVLSPLKNHSNNPDAALNPDGRAVLTWFQAAAGKLMTFVSERDAGSSYFSHPGPEQVVSPSGTDVDNPVIAMSPSGTAAAAWQQITSAGTFNLLLASRDAAGEWRNPTSLDDRLADATDVLYNVDIAFVATGDLYVVWQARSGEDKGVFAMHRAPDGTWLTPPGEPFRLSDPDVAAFDPSLAVGERGVIVSWTERNAEDEFRVVARRSAAGLLGAESARWGTTTQLSTAGLASGGSHVAIGGPDDRAACVWTEEGRGLLATID